ncbi:hypothetical protein AB3662_01320 [Sorangium cellulosum]|uniref:hypothetical protein n=1 Tax=Sorangium cellulosum TaxID=56 RepID=UPI003D9A7270
MADVRQERVIRDAQRDLRRQRVLKGPSVRTPPHSRPRTVAPPPSIGRARATHPHADNLRPAVQEALKQIWDTFANLGRILGVELTQVNQAHVQPAAGIIGMRELREELASLRARVQELERESHCRATQGSDHMSEDDIPSEFVMRNKIVLPVEKWNRFVDLIDTPTEPTDSLRRLFDEED